MAKASDKKADSDKTAGQKAKLLEILNDISTHDDKFEELVQLLEGIHIPGSYPDADQYHIFCQAYTIKLLQKYVINKDDREILLALYRLLEGYENFTTVKALHEHYAKEAFGYNKRIKVWKNPDSTLSKKESKIIENLTDRLMDVAANTPEHKGWLNLADIVVKELSERFPEGLPKKLPLPSPSYLAPATTPQIAQMTNLPLAEEDLMTLESPETKESTVGGVQPTAPIQTIEPDTLEEDALTDDAGKNPQRHKPDKGNEHDEAISDSPAPAIVRPPVDKPIRPKPKPKSYKKWNVVIIVVITIAAIFLSIVVGTIIGKSMSTDKDDDEDPNQSHIPLDFVGAGRVLFDDDMDTIIKDAQCPIAAYNESGEYDIDAMRSLIENRILANPIFGDMVARGLIDFFSIANDRMFESNPWLAEFVEITNSAMDAPNEYQEGMRKWLYKTRGVISTTDEYKDYAQRLCAMLDCFLKVGVYDLKTTKNWSIGPNTNGVYTRAVLSTENLVQEAFVLQYKMMGGSMHIVGFSVNDGRVMVSNPLDWGLDAFIEQ